MASEISLIESPEWKALQEHYKVATGWHMRGLFEDNPDRFKQLRYVLGTFVHVPSLNLRACV